MKLPTARLVRAGAITVLISTGAANAQERRPIVFDSEVIRVTLSADRLHVDGTYFLLNANATDMSQRLFYPFPLDDQHAFPDSITVTSLSPQLAPIPFIYRREGISFDVLIPASGTAAFQVIYEQPCSVSEACYILTSTAAWKRPIARASFEIHVPKDLELVSCAYEVGEPRAVDGMLVYEFSFDDFMPTRDLCLRWRVRS